MPSSDLLVRTFTSDTEPTFHLVAHAAGPWHILDSEGNVLPPVVGPTGLLIREAVRVFLDR